MRLTFNCTYRTRNVTVAESRIYDPTFQRLHCAQPGRLLTAKGPQGARHKVGNIVLGVYGKPQLYILILPWQVVMLLVLLMACVHFILFFISQCRSFGSTGKPCKSPGLQRPSTNTRDRSHLHIVPHSTTILDHHNDTTLWIQTT